MSTLDTMMPPAPLLSESGSLTPVTLDKINELLSLGRFPTEPVALENGIFYFQRGAYAFFRYKNGTRVCLYAPNPDDLVLEDVVLDDRPHVDGDETLIRHSPTDPWIRAPKGKVLPRRPKDLGNGNLNRLWVFAPGQEDAADKDAMQEMQLHQSTWQDLTVRYGYLKRINEDLLLSKGIVYEFFPDDANDPSPKAKGQLIVTPSPHGGWRLDHNYQKLFHSKNVPFFGLNPTFMRAASLRRKDISREDANKIALEDFTKRAFAFVWQNKKSYEYALAPDIEGKSHLKNPTLRKVRALMNKTWWGQAMLLPTRLKLWTWIKRGATNAYYGLKKTQGLDWGKNALLTLAVNIPFLVIDLLTNTINPFVFGGRLASPMAGKAGQRIMEYARQQSITYRKKDMHDVMNELTHDWDDKQFLGGRFKTKMAIDLQGMTNEELQLDSLGQEHISHKLQRKRAALSYIMSTLCASYGSDVSYFQCGKTEGVRIDENCGLSVEYIPAAKMAFARLDWTKLDRTSLPGFVTDLFIEDSLEGAPYLIVRYDRATRSLSSQFVDEKTYIEEWHKAGIHKEREARAAHAYVEVFTPKPAETYTNRALARRFTRSVRKVSEDAGELADNVVEKVFDVLKP